MREYNIYKCFRTCFNLFTFLYLFIPTKIVVFFFFVFIDFEAEDGENEDDPELMQDSIYFLDLNQYLTDFLSNFSSHHEFPVYVQHLNIQERKVLTKLNINA